MNLKYNSTMVPINEKKIQFIKKLNIIACKIADYYEIRLSLVNIACPEISWLPIYYLSHSDLMSITYESHHSEIITVNELTFFTERYPLYLEIHILQRYILWCTLKYQVLLDSSYLIQFLSDIGVGYKVNYTMHSLLENINRKTTLINNLLIIQK